MKRILVLVIFSLFVTAAGFAGDRELFNEAEGRFRGGNYAVALDLYSRLVNENRLSPYIPDAQFRRAVSYYQLGRYREAAELFKLVRSRYPSTAYYELVPFWQGRLALEFEDYEKAAEYFNEYIREGDASVLSEAYLYRALSYNSAGRLSDAAWSLELLLQNDEFKDDGYITALLFSLYLKEGRYSEILSVSDNSNISGFKPEYRNRVKLYIAEAHYLLGNDIEAEKLYLLK
jgi:tetratricopeptide (TPR) repeat protein